MAYYDSSMGTLAIDIGQSNIMKQVIKYNGTVSNHFWVMNFHKGR